MRILAALASEGGYVCAEFSQHDRCLVGYVPPKTQIELFRGVYGHQDPKLAGRPAILKSLRLRRAKCIEAADAHLIRIGRPQQGAISRWPSAKNRIADLVEERRRRSSLSSLLDYQQDVMVSEFLRTPAARRARLPLVAQYLTSIGRTMKDVVLYGITSTGQKVLAQITYLGLSQCDKKLQALRRHRSSNTRLVLFCNCEAPSSVGGVQIFPLKQAYERFRATAKGKLWLRMALADS